MQAEAGKQVRLLRFGTGKAKDRYDVAVEGLCGHLMSSIQPLRGARHGAERRARKAPIRPAGTGMRRADGLPRGAPTSRAGHAIS